MKVGLECSDLEIVDFYFNNENQFQILSTGNLDFDCKIREALLIKLKILL